MDGAAENRRNKGTEAMKKMTLAAGLLAVAGVGSVGCKTAPKLAWWKPNATAESTAIAHTAPALPSDLAKQTPTAGAAAQVAPGQAVRTASAVGAARRPGRLPEHGCTAVYGRRRQPHHQCADAAIAFESDHPNHSHDFDGRDQLGGQSGHNCRVALQPGHDAESDDNDAEHSDGAHSWTALRRCSECSNLRSAGFRLARYEPGRRRRREHAARWSRFELRRRDFDGAPVFAARVDACAPGREHGRRGWRDDIRCDDSRRDGGRRRRQLCQWLCEHDQQRGRRFDGAVQRDGRRYGRRRYRGRRFNGRRSTGRCHRDGRALSPGRHGNVSDTVAGPGRVTSSNGNSGAGSNARLCAECRPAWWCGKFDLPPNGADDDHADAVLVAAALHRNPNVGGVSDADSARLRKRIVLNRP